MAAIISAAYHTNNGAASAALAAWCMLSPRDPPLSVHKLRGNVIKIAQLQPCYSIPLSPCPDVLHRPNHEVLQSMVCPSAGNSLSADVQCIRAIVRDIDLEEHAESSADVELDLLHLKVQSVHSGALLWRKHDLAAVLIAAVLFSPPCVPVEALLLRIVVCPDFRDDGGTVKECIDDRYRELRIGLALLWIVLRGEGKQVSLKVAGRLRNVCPQARRPSACEPVENRACLPDP